MSSQIEIKNAVIKGTMLGIEDHGIMTCMLYLDFGGSGQGFGGYALDSWDRTLNRRVGTAYGTKFIMRVMEVVGVEKWEKLSGVYVRAKADHSKVYEIGNIIKNDWFNPSSLVI